MQTTPGLFGKIPAQGDFIERNLQRSFTLAWDDWLQRCLASSREQLGERWLETYLSSPLWRFCLSAGAVDNIAWAGILMPSVDRVGRYYPLTLAQPLAGHSNLFEFQSKNDTWYTALENFALTTLQSTVDSETLMAELGNVPAATECIPGTSQAVVRLANGWVIHSDETQAASSFGQLLHHVLSPQYPSHSLWWCANSQLISPTCIHVQGLPTAEQFSAMLNGHWFTVAE